MSRSIAPPALSISRRRNSRIPARTVGPRIAVILSGSIASITALMRGSTAFVRTSPLPSSGFTPAAGCSTFAGASVEAAGFSLGCASAGAAGTNPRPTSPRICSACSSVRPKKFISIATAESRGRRPSATACTISRADVTCAPLSATACTASVAAVCSPPWAGAASAACVPLVACVCAAAALPGSTSWKPIGMRCFRPTSPPSAAAPWRSRISSKESAHVASAEYSFSKSWSLGTGLSYVTNTSRESGYSGTSCVLIVSCQLSRRGTSTRRASMMSAIVIVARLLFVTSPSDSGGMPQVWRMMFPSAARRFTRSMSAKLCEICLTSIPSALVTNGTRAFRCPPWSSRSRSFTRSTASGPAFGSTITVSGTPRL